MKSSRNQSYILYSANNEKGNITSHEASITWIPTPDMDIMRKDNYKPTPLMNINENSKNNNDLAR